MGMLIKGDLLDVEIPVKQKISLIINDKGEKNYCCHCSGKKKHFPVMVFIFRS